MDRQTELAEVFAQVAEGAVHLDTRITLGNADRREGSGVLAALDEGPALTVADLAELMIVVSDNTATALLLRVVGADRVNARMRALSLVGPRVGIGFAGRSRAPTNRRRRPRICCVCSNSYRHLLEDL